MFLVPVLHSAVEVGADGTEGTQFPGWVPDENTRLAAELEDPAGVGANLGRFPRERHVGSGRFAAFGWDQVAGDRIEHRDHHGPESAPEEEVDETSSGVRRCVHR